MGAIDANKYPLFAKYKTLWDMCDDTCLGGRDLGDPNCQNCPVARQYCHERREAEAEAEGKVNGRGNQR
ncbi:MAG: hypothetical protein LBF86_01985 [Helicobacteraceae bacterium]|jgi:hypothetical protein|nr:hypothetical protein [Helicobacteraceae bacterium]